MINELLVRVTYRCNKKCKFCFNYVFDDKVKYDTNEDLNIEKLIEFIQKHGIKKVHLSGGEPTMYKDIYYLVNRLSKISKFSYFTNGMLFDRFTTDEISAMGILRIKVSLYNEEILGDSLHFMKMCEKIKEIKLKNPAIKFKASFMIDTDFFKVINSENYKIALDIFDNIKWQPLTVGTDNELYPTTIEGMDKKLREKIFKVLNTFPDNKVEAYEKVLDGIPADVCYMGKNYLTLNPDMTISLCPHLNENVLSIDEYEKIIVTNNNFFIHPNCRTMRCISLQAFLERKYGGN